jgi:hypothetical protein
MSPKKDSFMASPAPLPTSAPAPIPQVPKPEIKPQIAPFAPTVPKTGETPVIIHKEFGVEPVKIDQKNSVALPSEDQLKKLAGVPVPKISKPAKIEIGGIKIASQTGQKNSVAEPARPVQYTTPSAEIPAPLRQVFSKETEKKDPKIVNYGAPAPTMPPSNNIEVPKPGPTLQRSFSPVPNPAPFTAQNINPRAASSQWHPATLSPFPSNTPKPPQIPQTKPLSMPSAAPAPIPRKTPVDKAIPEPPKPSMGFAAAKDGAKNSLIGFSKTEQEKSEREADLPPKPTEVKTESRFKKPFFGFFNAKSTNDMKPGADKSINPPKPEMAMPPAPPLPSNKEDIPPAPLR